VELVVLNGRQSGARRALAVPVTLVGRATGCDVRLNVEEVEPFHCLIATGADGVTLRDLNSARGTFVNGQRIRAAVLRDGDLLDIGPFRFRIAQPPTPPVEEKRSADYEALRIQAAAVAAQQAALDEDEARLLQGQRALEEREAKLAEQVETRRRELQETAAELERGQADLRAGRERLAADEATLAERAATLEKVKARLQARQGELAVRQVHFNTELELDSRLLQDGWDSLHRDRTRWRDRRRREGMAGRARWVRLIEGERKLAQLRAVLQQEKDTWEAQQRILEGELNGLNNRIVQQRRKLTDQHQELRARAVRPAEPTPEPPAEAALAARSAELDRLAGALADQRTELLEHWDRLVRAREAWQAEHDEATAALATVAERLSQREDDLDRREQAIDAAEGPLRQAEGHAEELRLAGAAAHARLEVQRRLWQTEHEQALEEAGRLAEAARRQLDDLGQLRAKWNRKRRQETEALRADRAVIEQLRRDLTAAQLDLGRQAQQLVNEGRRALAAAAPPQEQPESARPVGGWLSRHAELIAVMEQQRAAMIKELKLLERLRQELSETAAELAHTRAELQQQATAVEHREALLAANQARQAQEQYQAEARRQHVERRLTTLQEETEHLARALLPETPPDALERAA
jgi:chromosome segregation ATPase